MFHVSGSVRIHLARKDWNRHKKVRYALVSTEIMDGMHAAELKLKDSFFAAIVMDATRYN